MTASRRKPRARRSADGERSITDDLRALPDDPGTATLSGQPAPSAVDRVMPQPSFTPAPVAVHEVPAPVAQAPLGPWVPDGPMLPPVIGDSIPPPPPMPVHDPEPEPEPGTDTVLYSMPGWAWLPTAQREAEREELDLIAERGHGLNASEEATAFRHSRQNIARRARQLCADVGQPELAGVLLRRVSAWNEQAQRDRAARASGPQPAVPQGGRHARRPAPVLPDLSHYDHDKLAGRTAGRRAS